MKNEKPRTVGVGSWDAMGDVLSSIKDQVSEDEKSTKKSNIVKRPNNKGVGKTKKNIPKIDDEILTQDDSPKTNYKLAYSSKNNLQSPNKKYTPSKEYLTHLSEKNRKEREALGKYINNSLLPYFGQMDQEREMRETGVEISINEAGSILRDNKITKVIVTGEKISILGLEEKIQGLRPDLDAYTALYLLNNYNNKSIEETYGDGAVTSILRKGDPELNETEKGLQNKMVSPTSGLNHVEKYEAKNKPDEASPELIVYVDAGGEWIKFKKNGLVSTLHLDHHGKGKREETSGTKVMLEAMKEAGILKDLPPWFKKFTDFVTDIDNMSYAKEVKNGKKVFNEGFFINEWPNSMYALAEKQIPFETFMKLCKPDLTTDPITEPLITDPTKPFTDEQLNGALGQYKIGEKTISDLCKEQREEVKNTLRATEDCSCQKKKAGYNLVTDELGKIVYHNYKIRGENNKILDHLATKATLAKGFDSYVNWNKKHKKFYINSLESESLGAIADRLNDKFPGCATEVRGNFIFGKIVEGITEEEFLNTISVSILKNVKIKNGKIDSSIKNTEPKTIDKDVVEPVSQDQKDIEKKEPEPSVSSVVPNEIPSEVTLVEKVINIKNDIEKTLNIKQDKQEEEKEINAKLKIVGINPENLNEKWKNFTRAEKLLILEQASQETLSKVKEIGEKRFEEKNKINLSWNPSKWNPFSMGKKVLNKIGKSYWISKEEKEVIAEVEKGENKLDEKILNSLIERQSDLGLSVIEKEGKAFIEFATINKNISQEQKNIIDKFNQVANNFSKMPDSWKNERSAKSTDKMFTKENHLKFEEIKNEYEKEKASFIMLRVKQYEESGMNKKEAKEKAMLDIKDIDFKLSMLQFTNTNPDAIEELNKIKNESSWGRLVNNENIWRTGYMTMGYAARAGFHSTLGLLTAPLTAGIIGGIRARRKANQSIDNAFNTGRKEETFLERREKGKKGLYDDKNIDQGVFSYVLSGSKVNTKEVAAFVDADSQKQRIDNLVNKINNTKDNKQKLSLVSQLKARLNYIEQKQAQGLINYGVENPVFKNYELFKALSVAYVTSTTIENIRLDIPLTKEMEEDIMQRDRLLKSVMAKNIISFGEKIAAHKNSEMLRGALVGTGFAALGGMIRDWMHGDSIEQVATVAPATNIVKPIEKIIEHANVEATADHGQGAISTLRELQKNLKVEYGNNIDNAPASVKHILNTDAHKLAQEYGMYKPGQDAESAFIKSGSSFKVDGHGNLTYHEVGSQNELTLEKGVDVKASEIYEGRMSDTDHSGSRFENSPNGENAPDNYEIPPQEKIGSVDNISNELPSKDDINTDLPQESNPYKMPPQEKIGGGNINSERLESASSLSGNVNQSINPELLRQVDNSFSENINHIFTTEKLQGDWAYIKTHTSAEKLMEITKGINDTMNPDLLEDSYYRLIMYVNRLKDISKESIVVDSLTTKAESIPEYITRATKKIAEMGKLDQIKL